MKKAIIIFSLSLLLTVSLFNISSYAEEHPEPTSIEIPLKNI